MYAQTADYVMGTGEEDARVRGLYVQLMDGWNQGSAAAFASAFAEDADLIGFDGTHLRGRREIAAFHQPLFEKWLKGTRLVGEIKSVVFPSRDVAVMHATGGTVMPGKSKPSRERDSIQTLVATRCDGEWRLTAFQNTRVRPMGRPIRNTLLWLLTDLLWKRFGTTRYRAGLTDVGWLRRHRFK